MTDYDSNQSPFPSSETLPVSPPVEPSWKPLLWVVGGLVMVIGLWEVFLELGLNLFEILLEILEKAWLILIEAPEEFLEDLLESWLKNHFPHEADRYSEIVTAIGLTPLKILLIILLLRWLWGLAHGKLIPRFAAYVKRQYTAVHLAWQALGWPVKILIGLAAVGGLLVIL